MPTVTITRSKLYPCGRGNYRAAWKWTYEWTADDNSHLRCLPDQDRTVNVGLSAGTHLASLIDALKRRYRKAGQTVTIVKDWDRLS